MKTNQTYVLLSLITAVAVLGVSLGNLGFAQTVTPVTCSVSQSSVTPNQSVTLTASGGTGSYAWSGPNLTTTNTASSSIATSTATNTFTVSYPSVGNYPVTVTSGAQTATCNVDVAAVASTPTSTTSSGTLVCSPTTQNVTLGQSASVSATGGDGVNYTWSAPDLSIANPSGSGFSANYASTGTHTLTVTSAGNSSTCTITVLANNSSTTVPPVVTPSLPDTGGGYGK